MTRWQTSLAIAGLVVALIIGFGLVQNWDVQLGLVGGETGFNVPCRITRNQVNKPWHVVCDLNEEISDTEFSMFEYSDGEVSARVSFHDGLLAGILKANGDVRYGARLGDLNAEREGDGPIGKGDAVTFATCHQQWLSATIQCQLPIDGAPTSKFAITATEEYQALSAEIWGIGTVSVSVDAEGNVELDGERFG